MLEDSSSDARLIEIEIKESGIPFVSKRVESRKDFEEALTQYAPDLILSDYLLPAFDGMSALKQVQKQGLSTPVIIVTGALDEETAVEFMKAGAADYVLKNHLGRLVPAIRSAVEKFRAQEALAASQTRYLRLFESAREGILLLEDDLIADINPFLLRLMGMEKDTLIGKSIWDIGLSLNHEEIENRIVLAGGEGYVHFEELTLQLPDGRLREIELNYNRFLSDGKVMGQCNIRDISERKQAEAIRAQLFQAQKMEAIGTLAGGVAHDFNNVMTAIQVSADLAMMKISDEDPVYKEFNEIRHAALRAAGLIRQLLLFSRDHPMEPIALRLNSVVENLSKMLNRLISEDIDIAIELDPELWTIRADLSNMEQVIMNLVLNARDAMPKGGRLMIQTKNVVLDEVFCKTMPEARPGQFVCLSINDTGVGMDQETLLRVFDPFFTTKEPGKGTGLGLAVVYGIVKQHDGWIHVNTFPDYGSTFQVYLPAVNQPPQKIKELKDSIDTYFGKGETLLLVEDEEKVREFTTKALNKCGYSVVATCSAQEALRIFETRENDFDLIFTDVVLSDQNGIELVEILLSRNPNLRVLLSSGYLDQKSQWPIIVEKGFPFLQKPYTLSGLLQAIRLAMSQR